jgi:hypothetical protein
MLVVACVVSPALLLLSRPSGYIATSVALACSACYVVSRVYPLEEVLGTDDFLEFDDPHLLRRPAGAPSYCPFFMKMSILLH